MPKDLLKHIEEQEKIARQFGFYWGHIDELIEQIQSECIEIKEAWQKEDREHLQEEIGDLLLAAVSLAIFCGLDPHSTLLKSSEKYQKRYDQLVTLVQKDGFSHLRDQPTDILLKYWNQAKKQE